MSFISRVIRYLFWLLVVSWSVALLRRVVGRMLNHAMGSRSQTASRAAQGMKQGVNVNASSDAAGAARRLVRDPVCGAHVAEVLAIPLREGGELLHFCSVACRDQYLRMGSGSNASDSTKKFAANG
jgi:YHS domain-containing protein